MSTPVKPDHYMTLLNDITALYDVARHALVEAYWKIGKRIVEEEQQGQENAVYGDHLLDQLSKDLSATLGSGFSRRNIYNMRQFYLTHKEIVQLTAQLTWTQHVELLPIKKASDRRKLEGLVLKKKWSQKQIRKAVREVTQSEQPQAVAVSLAFVRAPLHTFMLVDQAKAPYPRGKVMVDCGFNIWRSVPRTQMPQVGEASYTYPARVESVIDGDTIWAVIDCGFDTFIREKLRLHRIDTPELGTVQGAKARRYVRRTLKACPLIVIQTHKTDKYARYLSDIFYLPGSQDPDRIGREGRSLNQELLDRGLAKPWKP